MSDELNDPKKKTKAAKPAATAEAQDPTPAADPVPAQATEPAPAPADEPAAAEDDGAAPGPSATLIPHADGTDPGDDAKALLIDACERFGVNPAAEVRPLELKSWRFYPADTLTDTPAAVVIVTAGGRKLKHWDDPDHPMDQDTEDQLRLLFHAYSVDPRTKERIPQPLPADLTLPNEAVTGRVTSTRHVYQGGYLKSGGKTEAAKRRKAGRR